jgi:hypothetical protein
MAEPTWLDEGARERIRIECLTIESTCENTKNALIALFNVYANEYCAAGAPEGDAGPLEQIPVLVYEAAVSRQWLRDRAVQPVRGPARPVKGSDGRTWLLRPAPVALPDEALSARIGKYPVRPGDLAWLTRILFRPTRACLARIGRMRIGAEKPTGATFASSLSASAGALKSQAADSEGTPDGKRKVQEIVIPGVAWDDVELVVTDQELRISVRGKTRVVSFLEVGFGKRDQKLELLMYFAAARGKLRADFTFPKQSKTPLKSVVSRLRRVLQNLIPIDGDPVEYHMKAGLYKCSFQIKNSADNSFPTPNGATWLDFSFHLQRDGRLRVSVSARHSIRTLGGTGSASDKVEDLPQPESAVSNIYSFEDLGLRTSTGALTPEGKAFEALLRGGGRLEAKGDDMAILKLAERLRTWTGLKGDPLQFAGSTRMWRASFDCASSIRE